MLSPIIKKIFYFFYVYVENNIYISRDLFVYFLFFKPLKKL